MSDKVINAFVHHRDNDRLYNIGEVFPHKDCSVEVTEEELNILRTSNNSSKVPFILNDSVKEPDEDKPVAKYTKDELKVFLDKQGVPYEEDAKKEDLLVLAKDGQE